MDRLAGTLIVIAVAIASPATAAVETLIAAAGPADTGSIAVEVRFLNTGATAVQIDPPERIDAQLTVDGRSTAVTLERIARAVAASVAPQAFVAARYTALLPVGTPIVGQGVLSLAGGAAFAVAVPARVVAATTPAVVEPRLLSADGDTGNAYLGNLSAYEPIYAVYGPGTNTAAKIQISFKYQLFDRGGADQWLDGLHFAYSQRMYWDLGGNSSPFRNVDYAPELIYILAAHPAAGSVAFGGQAGARHESNGRDGTASRSLNTVYLQPVATLPIGRYRLTLGPRLWAFVGDRGDNPDIERYRGNTGLFAEFGDDNGLRVTTNSRLNFGSGKGAIDVSASYPLSRLAPQLNLYVFGQGFTGYGENLLDYDRRQTRLRVGFGFVR